MKKKPIVAHTSALIKKKPRGKPFEQGNPYAFKKGDEWTGNPGGRPKSVSGAYKAWLEQVDEATGLTHAQLVAQAQGAKAITQADTNAAKELRQATEGDTFKFSTWQNELIDALKSGNLTPEQVVKELGIDDARAILVAAGAAVPAGAPEQQAPDSGEAGGGTVS